MAAPIGGAFGLTDHHGRAVTDETFLGRPALLYFGFTNCRVVCPRALARLTAALDRVGAGPGDIRPLFVSVDPARDTPAAMKAYLDAVYPRFLGLTGAREQVEAMKAAYKVFARRTADALDPDGYGVAHTAFTYLLDADGRYAAHLPDSADEARIDAALRAVIGK